MSVLKPGVDLRGFKGEQVERLLIKTGNREYVDLDFRWILSTNVVEQSTPSQLAVFERSKNGNFYGYITSVIKDGKSITGDTKLLELEQLVERAVRLMTQRLISKWSNWSYCYDLERLRLEEKSLVLKVS